MIPAFHAEYSEQSLLAGDRPLQCAISSLSLSCFRNYSELEFETSPSPVVLIGANGAGKTNVLEAISLLVPGRGLRKASLSSISHAQSGHPWAVAAMISGACGASQIGTALDPESEDRRFIKIDGKPVRSQAELATHLSILWLTPQIEHLFHEGSSAQRKFMDRMVYGFDSGHATRINEYDYAMRERNRLLAEGRFDPHWLDALELTMAETGASIASARLEALVNVNHAIMASRHSFPKAHLAVGGWMEDRLSAGEPAISAETHFQEALASNRRLDAAAGRTLIGVHRSEWHVFHLGKQMTASLCSTGEQKALMLSIVLAQARASIAWKRVIPLLLLDEMTTHLDSTRRLELFEEICQTQAQVWMTGTDAEIFADLGSDAQRFRVEEGKVFSL